VLIEREIEIRRPVQAVFDYVSDPRNDPVWCRKVISVEQVGGEGPGPGSRYTVVHKPVPGRPPRNIDHSCLGWDPPERIEWREDDGTDVFRVEYLLEPTADGTRIRQRSDAELGSSRLLRPLYRAGIGRDIAGQLRSLKKVLEAG
jgi:uncharacterized protein YndB with AHSA1/START domain